MSDLMTKRDFARHVGVKPPTISTWIARKQLTAPALLSDGRIDVDLAKQQLAARLDLARSLGRSRGGLFAHVAKPEPASVRADEKVLARPEYAQRIGRVRGDLLELTLKRREFNRQLAAGEVTPVSEFRRDVGARVGSLVQMIDAAIPEWAELAWDAETAAEAVVRLRGDLDRKKTGLRLA